LQSVTFLAPESAGLADVTLVSSDGISIQAHSFALRASSDFFRKLLVDGSTGASSAHPVSREIHLVDNELETNEVLVQALKLCYNLPVQELNLVSFDTWIDIYRLGVRWGAMRVIEVTGATLTELYVFHAAFKRLKCSLLL